MRAGLVLIPAYNEAPRIGEVLEATHRHAPDFDRLVVDDASHDDTAAVARRAGAWVVRHPFNMGYGAALQTGYQWALARGAERVVQLDADGQHDPALIEALLRPLEKGECDIVLGSRFLEETGYAMGPFQTLGRKVFEALGRFAGVEVTDPTTGFQALDRHALELYVEDFFPHDYPDVDVLVVAARRGLRIQECSTAMGASPRPSTLHGGLRAFYYAYKMLLSLWAASSRRPGHG